jgi:formyl-CoA transferase
VSANKPLEGIKVIELGQLIAGPFAGKMFAEFGAEVIKIEPPAADGQPAETRCASGASSTTALRCGGTRRRATRNRSRSTRAWREGQEIVRTLARDADIVIENFRPGTMEKWGLGYERLAAENPGLIMLRLSGFGQTGPYRDQAGFGAIGESMGGLRYLTGYPDRPPVRSNLSIGDSLASLHGVIGAMMALHHRNMNGGRISGKGQVVDVALYEAVFSMLESTLPEFDMYGVVRERSGSNLSGIVPSNTYLTKDGQHVLIAANGDSIFKRLCAAMGRNDLGSDPALADNAGRAKRAEELDAAIGGWAAQHSAAALLRLLDAAQVPNGKIYSIADIARDPQYLAREMIRQFTLKDGTPLKLPGIVPKLSATPGDVNWVGPELGAHTDEVLGAHGYDAAAIAELRQRKVI